MQVEGSWNVMAHAQKPDIVFRRNGRVHLNWRRASVQSTTGSRGVRISGSNAGCNMFRFSVKSTGYPLNSPVSSSLPHPCVTVCHHISTGVYDRCVNTALFCYIPQQVMLIPYWHFGTPYRSRLQGSSIQEPLNMGTIGCPETPVRNYHYWLRNITEDSSFQVKQLSKRLLKIPNRQLLSYRKLQINVKVKVTHPPWRHKRGRKVQFYFFFNLGAWWRWVINIMPPPPYPRDWTGIHCIRWLAPRTVLTSGKMSRDSIPGPPSP